MFVEFLIGCLIGGGVVAAVCLGIYEIRQTFDRIFASNSKVTKVIFYRVKKSVIEKVVEKEPEKFPFFSKALKANATGMYCAEDRYGNTIDCRMTTEDLADEVPSEGCYKYRNDSNCYAY